VTDIEVLLPFYGDVGYLRLAVRSVLSQTDPDWRLTVVDDGYPDPTVADWFAQLGDSRVRYHRNPTNLGANGNYRHALEMAEADYVVVMGADDLMLPGYVGLVREVVTRHPCVAVVQPGVQVVDEAGRAVNPLVDKVKRGLRPRVPGGVATLEGEGLGRSLLRANWTYFPSLCWNRRLISEVGFRQGLDVVQDLALLLDVTSAGGTMVVLDDVVFAYRRHSGSDSAVRALAGSRFEEERRFFRTAAADSHERGWTSAARAARVHLTSRLNAASLVPAAAKARAWGPATSLLRHIFTT
jgi:glycosyltransferase involved in cell wall biosynthesis